MTAGTPWIVPLTLSTPGALQLLAVQVALGNSLCEWPMRMASMPGTLARW